MLLSVIGATDLPKCADLSTYQFIPKAEYWQPTVQLLTALLLLTICRCQVVPVHAMKAYWRSRGIAPFILDIGAVVSFTLRSFYPRG